VADPGDEVVWPEFVPPVRPRRKRGTGSIYFRKADGLWIGEAKVKGERRIVSGVDEEEATWRLDRLVQAGVETGRLDPDPDKIIARRHSVETWCRAWLSGAGVRPGTLRRYESDMRHHVLPVIGHLPLTGIGPFQVGQVMIRMRDKGLSDSTKRNIRNEMSALFKSAIAFGLIDINPAQALKMRATHLRAADVPVDPDLAARILAAVAGSSIEDIVTLAYYTAARQGELLGLSWDRIIWSRSIMSVRRSLALSAEGKIVIGEPKTRKSIRDIPLIPAAMDLLVRRWVAAGEPRKGWVFPGRVEGRWMSGSWVTHEFKRLMKDAGLPETLVFHSLRHLSLSLMLAAGVELPVVSRIAGHATVAVTAQVYSHVVSGRERQGVEALDLARWHPVGE
jgi:integrase